VVPLVSSRLEHDLREHDVIIYLWPPGLTQCGCSANPEHDMNVDLKVPPEDHTILNQLHAVADANGGLRHGGLRNYGAQNVAAA